MELNVKGEFFLQMNIVNRGYNENATRLLKICC